MFTFIHCADIHLDSPLLRLEAYEGAPVEEFRQATRRAFENLVQLALAERAAFVLIAGDLYDGDWRDYNTGLFFAARMARLQEAGIPVFLIAGNHDAASRITRSLRLPDNVRLFPADRPATFRLEEPRVAVHGQSFAGPAVTEDLAAGYPAPLPGYFNIGLLHTAATGYAAHEPYAPCTPAALAAKGYDYWALGHVHQHEVLATDPPIVFPGNLQGRHIREAGPKGCVRVRVDEAGRPALDFTPLDVVRWAAAEVAVDGAADAYAVVDRVREHLEALAAANPGLPLAVRALIRGATAAHGALQADPERWASEIRAGAAAVADGRIWVEKVRLDTRPPDVEANLPRSGAVGELLAVFDALAADPAARRELFAELAELQKKLPRELLDGGEALRFDDPQWSAEMLESARQMLVRRLLHREDGP